jgi:hypothetical protein
MQEHRAIVASWEPIRNSLEQQDFPEMLSAVYFHPFSSHVAASVVGIGNDREGQRFGYQLPSGAEQNSIKIGSFFCSSDLVLKFHHPESLNIFLLFHSQHFFFL